MSEIWNLSTLCRCCHADGHFMSLNSSYQHTGTNDVEIYDTMLRDTLGIFISNQLVSLEVSYTICDSCIFKLRNATEFKKQVLMCEEKLKLYCNSQEIDDNWIDDQSGDVKKEYDIEFDDMKLPAEEDKKENIPKIEIEGIRSEPETKQKSERIPTKKIKSKDDINRQKVPKNKEQRVNLDRSFIIQVDTNSGSQFSCKDCGGLYQTEKDINKHIFKEHAALLKCDFCSKELKSYSSLKNHLKLHTEKELICNYCSKKFASKKAVSDHRKCHTNEIIYKCDLCKKDFKYKQSLIRHLRVHAGTNKKILCDVCGWSFNDKSNLDAHIRAVHEKLRPFHCKICKKTYTNQRHLRDHLKVHNGDRNLYKCDVCDRRLSCPKTMQIHRLKHDNKFMCRHCSKIFDDATSKIEHVRAVHSKVPPWFTCPLCGKAFSAKYSLNRHIDGHNGIKKFSCNLCGLKFTQKVVLNRHIFRKHSPEADTDIEKTKCDICQRSYKNIVLHMDKHRNRLCTCEMCGKAYWNKSALNRHKSLKHFDKSYNCTICEKKYLKKSSLNVHKKKVHQIKIEKNVND